jgi:hypothetical protein
MTEPSASLIGQILGCADRPGTPLRLGALTIAMNGDWLGSKDSKTMLISAEVADGPAPLGGGLDLLTDTFGSGKKDSDKLELPRWLQSGATGASIIKLKHLVAGLERTESDPPAVVLIGFGLAIETGEWVLIDNLLSVTGLTADFSVLRPADPDLRQIQVSVGGKLQFAGAPVTVIARSLIRSQTVSGSSLADVLMKAGALTQEDLKKDKDLAALREVKVERQTRFDFEVEGRLTTEELKKKPVTLASVMQHFGWASGDSHNDPHQPPPKDPLSEIVITALEMRASTAPRSFDFMLELANKDLALGGEARAGGLLKLERLYLAVNGAADWGIAGTLGCDVTFGKEKNVLKAHVQAECDLAGGGWVFEGGLTVENPSKLKEALEETFKFTLPDFFKDLSPKETFVDLNFNTSTKEFNLSLRTGLTLDERHVDIRLDIAIAQDEKGWSPRFSGALDFGDAQTVRRFNLVVEPVGKDKTYALIAVYAEEGGEPINLRNLVGKVFTLPNVVPDVTFKIPGAGFAHEFGHEQRKPRNLFGVNIEGGFDLAAIKLEKLPIIHDSAAAGISARLDFQVVAADSEMKQDDDPLLAAIAAGGFAIMSRDIKSGAAFAAQLRLGNETLTLRPPDSAREARAEKVPAADGATKPTQDLAQQDDAPHWFDVHRKLGPLRFDRIGLMFPKKEKDSDKQLVALLMDAGFEFAGLQVSLDGLRMQSPLDTFAPTFGLSGLGVSYRSPSVEIGGALLLTNDEFRGAVIVKGPKFALSAVGLFSVVKRKQENKVVSQEDEPSLFIYATLNAALGGPPFFYVTGLAAGFGFNRDVLLPEAEGVRDFPLVSLALDEKRTTEPLEALGKLGSKMPASIGTIFAAVGVHFTSFKVLDSFALLVAKFVPRFEIDVLGTSTLVSPPGADVVVAKATLNLRARFVPEDGILAVRAVLGPDSFILSSACHLGGGFAFSAWFCKLPKTAEHEEISAGDFVVTLGGYHAAFKPPSHYPAVPRLSVDWAVSEHLSIKGSAYFALTGSHLMAGGRFEATWLSEDIRVAFTAGADFLMTWKPYHYDVTAYVSIAVDVTVHFFGTRHLTLDASADLHLWGPEFSGTIRLHLYVFGLDLPFDKEFGHGAVLAKAIPDWKTFHESFLPQDISSFGVRDGLLGTESEKIFMVAPKSLVLAYETAIPLTKMPSFAAQKKKALPPGVPRPALGPMGLQPEEVESTVEFDIQDAQGKSVQLSVKQDEDGKATLSFGDSERLIVSPIRKSAPAGIWGAPKTLPAPDGGRFLEPQALDANVNLKAGESFALKTTTIKMAADNDGSVRAGMSVFDSSANAHVGTVSSFTGTTLVLTAGAATASEGPADALVFAASPLIQDLWTGFEITLALKKVKEWKELDDKPAVADVKGAPLVKKAEGHFGGELDAKRRADVLRAFGLNPDLLAA